MVQGPERYDYLIVFGAAVRSDGSPSGTLRRRVEEAFKFAKNRESVRFLVTGGLCRHPPAEAAVMRRLLLELGASDNRIVVEDTAQNTLQSAVRCSAMIRERGDAGAVVICSSRYHIRRCRMLLWMNGIRADAWVVSHDAPRVGWIRYGYSWLREGVALPFDAIMMTGRWLRGALVLGASRRR